MTEISIEQLWNRIELWLKDNASEIKDALPAGATESQISELESQIGISIPTAMKQSYLIHNGSNDRSIFDAGALTRIIHQVAKTA